MRGSFPLLFFCIFVFIAFLLSPKRFSLFLHFAFVVLLYFCDQGDFYQTGDEGGGKADSTNLFVRVTKWPDLVHHHPHVGVDHALSCGFDSSKHVSYVWHTVGKAGKKDISVGEHFSDPSQKLGPGNG